MITALGKYGWIIGESKNHNINMLMFKSPSNFPVSLNKTYNSLFSENWTRQYKKEDIIGVIISCFISPETPSSSSKSSSSIKCPVTLDTLTFDGNTTDLNTSTQCVRIFPCRHFFCYKTLFMTKTKGEDLGKCIICKRRISSIEIILDPNRLNVEGVEIINKSPKHQVPINVDEESAQPNKKQKVVVKVEE